MPDIQVISVRPRSLTALAASPDINHSPSRRRFVVARVHSVKIAGPIDSRSG